MKAPSISETGVNSNTLAGPTVRSLGDDIQVGLLALHAAGENGDRADGDHLQARLQPGLN